MSPKQEIHPLASQTNFRLAAWKISGNEMSIVEFQRKLPVYWQNIPGEREHPALTTTVVDSGVAGVIENRLIHFSLLWQI